MTRSRYQERVTVFQQQWSIDRHTELGYCGAARTALLSYEARISAQSNRTVARRALSSCAVEPGPARQEAER